MITISGYEMAESFVDRLQKYGINVQWDGWSIVFFRPHPGGINDATGVRRGDVWGFETSVPLEPDGSWRINMDELRIK